MTGVVHRERDAHDAGLAGFARQNFQFAVVRLDDLVADGQCLRPSPHCAW